MNEGLTIMLSGLIFIVIYLAVAIITANSIVFLEKIERKHAGIYNWDDVDPAIGIIFGLLWPFSIPYLVICGLLWIIYKGIRDVFF